MTGGAPEKMLVLVQVLMLVVGRVLLLQLRAAVGALVVVAVAVDAVRAYSVA